MRYCSRLAFFSLLTILAPGCLVVTTNPVDQPYESCAAGEVCADSGQGFVCAGSTLPNSSYTGAFCTVGCIDSSDCPSDVSGYATVCVLYAAGAGQCYLTCPVGNNCPYGQACFNYADAFTGGSINLCTP